jgi:hypothetical protein
VRVARQSLKLRFIALRIIGESLIELVEGEFWSFSRITSNTAIAVSGTLPRASTQRSADLAAGNSGTELEVHWRRPDLFWQAAHLLGMKN